MEQCMSESKKMGGCREEAESRLRRIAEELREEEELGEEEELDNKKKMRRKKRRLTMERIQHPSKWSWLRRHELWDWDRFRGRYTLPTTTQFSLIEDYLYQFYWELPDFDESSQPEWLSINNRLQSPNLREHLIKFLHQIRHSKGFDVSFDFFNDPHKADLYRVLFEHPSTEYVPRDLKLKKVSDVAHAAAKFAIRKINTDTANAGATLAYDGNGSYMQSYELLSVDKLVSAVNHLNTKSISEFLFLTLTATQKYICVETEIEENRFSLKIQALVVLWLDKPSPDTFALREWTPISIAE